MCLGVPGRILAFDEASDQLARADVLGAERMINVSLLEDEPLAVGDWVLVHLGFALEILDEDGAAAAHRGLELVGRDDPARAPDAAAQGQQ